VAGTLVSMRVAAYGSGSSGMGTLHEQVFVTDPILQRARETGCSARPHDPAPGSYQGLDRECSLMMIVKHD
jgi:hypothetical protein